MLNSTRPKGPAHSSPARTEMEKKEGGGRKNETTVYYKDALSLRQIRSPSKTEWKGLKVQDIGDEHERENRSLI